MLVKLSDYYVLAYAGNMDQESQKNERKKVRNLIQKFKRTPDVFGGLAFDYISVEEQARIVHYFLEECDQREIINNLTKINVDVDYSFLEIDDQTNSNDSCFALDYLPLYIDHDIIRIRGMIRSPLNNSRDLLENLLDADNQLFQDYMREYVSCTAIGIKFDWIEYITSYIDFILNDILQFLLYPIMMFSSDIDPICVIDRLSSKCDILMDSFDGSVVQKYESIFADEGLKAGRVMKYFRAFISHRNRLFENSDIYAILIQEMERYPELFSEVPSEFKAPKILLTEDQINSDDFISIVTEDKHIPNFKNKIAKVRRFINIMQQYGNRLCYDTCLQDIKVYFREIYLSKQTYRRQKTLKIVDNYLKLVKQFQDENKDGLPPFQKESQYIFVREKISRGYFREKNLSSAYVAKIELTEKLDKLLLKCYWLADSRSALELLHMYNQELLLCYEEFL